MEIEQIVSTAKQQLGSTSLSDRTLTDYFTAHAPEGDPDEAFWAKHTSVLKSLSGQLSHEIAEWQKQYQKTHPATPPAQTPPAPPAPPAIDPALQAILDSQKQQLEQMKALFAQQQTQANESQLRSFAIENGKELYVEKPKLWNHLVGTTPIAEGMTPQQFAAAVKTAYEQHLQFYGDDVQGYGRGSGAGSNSNTKKELDAFFASKGMGPQ